MAKRKKTVLQWILKQVYNKSTNKNNNEDISDVSAQLYTIIQRQQDFDIVTPQVREQVKESSATNAISNINSSPIMKSKARRAIVASDTSCSLCPSVAYCGLL